MTITDRIHSILFGKRRGRGGIIQTQLSHSKDIRCWTQSDANTWRLIYFLSYYDRIFHPLKKLFDSLSTLHCQASFVSFRFVLMTISHTNEYFSNSLCLYQLILCCCKQNKNHLVPMIACQATIYDNSQDQDGPFCASTANNPTDISTLACSVDSKPAKYWPITPITSQHCLT